MNILDFDNEPRAAETFEPKPRAVDDNRVAEGVRLPYATENDPALAGRGL